MPEIEQTPENSYGVQQNVKAPGANHKKIEVVVIVFVVLVIVAVIAFLASKQNPATQPMVVGECIYSSDLDTMKESLAQTSLNLCNCVLDADMKSMCIAQVDDSLTYNEAMRTLKEGVCKNIQSAETKASCVLAVQDKIAYMGREGTAPSEAPVTSTDFAKKYEENPQDVNNLLNLAMSYGMASVGDGTSELSSEKLAEATALIAEAKTLEPRNAKIYVAEGFLLGLQGQNDEAITAYTKAVQFDGTSIEAFVSRAKMYEAMEMTSEAIADYEKATGLDTANMYAGVMIHGELCRLYADTANTEKATEKCNLVLSSAGSSEASKTEATMILESLQ